MAQTGNERAGRSRGSYLGTTPIHPPGSVPGRLVLPQWAGIDGHPWRDLVEAAPALGRLEAEVHGDIARLAALDGWCASEYWACPAGPKRRVGGFVGYRYPFDPILGTAVAYDAAKDHLRCLLPGCRHSGDCRSHERDCINCWEGC